METQQLKQLCGRLRALLEDVSITLGHSQVLDLTAALIGLRNWPEVQAFPQRVRSTDLDLSAASRLAYRLKSKHGHVVSAAELLQSLLSPTEQVYAATPQIWPAGPAAGVYLTTSRAAMAALIEQYQEASDGAVFYAERVGSDHDAAIDLGENGLWSSGLDRVPSGTLLALGPVELDQQSWSNAARHLEMACLRAHNSGHRVAVLYDTPVPDQLAADATLLIVELDAGDLHDQLVGTVSEQGDLIPSLMREYPTPIMLPATAGTSALAPEAILLLQAALARRSTGILTVGSFSELDNPGADVAEAALALTDHLGPAARIMPRHRGTMTKFDLVPPAVRQLPFLPSVESAYAQGYRRFLIDPRHTDSDTIPRFVNDAMFIACTWATSADELASVSTDYRHNETTLLPYLIAAVATVVVPTAQGLETLTDLYIGVDGAHVDDSEMLFDYIARNRTMRIEEQFARLVQAGLVDLQAANGSGFGHRAIKRLKSLLSE